jgi:hypothetical protein
MKYKIRQHAKEEGFKRKESRARPENELAVSKVFA